MLDAPLAFAKGGRNKPAPQESFQTGPNSLELIQPLNNLTADFYDFVLRYGGRLIPGKDLQPWIAKMHAASEAYLTAIGAEYSTKTIKREQLEFQGSFVEKISYNLYTITAIKNPQELNGDYLATLLNDNDLQELQLIFDPFLQLWSGAIQGYFEPASLALVFSTSALSYRVGGLADTLAHESFHAREHAALLRGEPSLASFTFFSRKPSAEVYAQFLRLDEADTHALDIEYLQTTAPTLEALVTDKSSLKRLREARQKALEFKIETLQRIIANTQGLLSLLRDEVQNQGLTELGCAPEPQSPLILCRFTIAEGNAYERLEIRWAPQSPSPQPAQLLKLLTWSLNRLANLTI